jgi:hypothetical protein
MKLNQSSSNVTGTNFATVEQTTKKSTTRWPGFPGSDQLMSAEGAALASVTAPSSAFVLQNKSTAAVKKEG